MSTTKQPDPQQQIVQPLPLDQIVTNENQSRKSFYQDTLEEMAAWANIGRRVDLEARNPAHVMDAHAIHGMGMERGGRTV